jgi:hypothetical protein
MNNSFQSNKRKPLFSCLTIILTIQNIATHLLQQISTRWAYLGKKVNNFCCFQTDKSYIANVSIPYIGKASELWHVMFLRTV